MKSLEKVRVPKDETLRFEWEGPPSMPKTQLNKPKDQKTYEYNHAYWMGRRF